MQSCFVCWLLTFSCCFLSGNPVASEEKWRELDFFLELVQIVLQPLIGFLIAGNLTEYVCSWSSTDLKFSRSSFREKKRIFPVHYLWCNRWKRKEKKERLSRGRAMIDRYRFRFVVTSHMHDKGVENVQWAMSKDELGHFYSSSPFLHCDTRTCVHTHTHTRPNASESFHKCSLF